MSAIGDASTAARPLIGITGRRFRPELLFGEAAKQL